MQHVEQKVLALTEEPQFLLLFVVVEGSVSLNLSLLYWVMLTFLSTSFDHLYFWLFQSVTVRWSMTIKAFVPSNYQMKNSNNTLLRWHTWHITMTHSWDSTHGILQWHLPEIAHMAYYNNTLLRWHTWHITMTSSWDGTHGILQLHPPEMAHMAYYNNTLLRWHTWHITITASWDGTHGILQWHPPEMAHMAYLLMTKVI